MNIRKAENKDFISICNLMKNELGYPQLNVIEAVKRLEYFKNSENHETFVAIINDEVVGFIGVMKNVAYNLDGYYSQIMALAVSANARRNGVGTALVKKVEEWSLLFGIDGVGVNSGLQRVDAHKFYEANGYVKRSFSFINML